MKVKKLALGVLLSALVATGSVYAGSTYQGFDVTIGKLAGNVATGSQTKQTGGANGALESTFNGGGYYYSARMEKTNGSAAGAWARKITKGKTVTLPGNSSQYKNSKIRVKMQSQWNQPVNFTVRGQWKSN